MHHLPRKAVVPAAGLGTRLLPATKAQPKEMLPLVDRPAIQYIIEEAVSAGLDDILVITGKSKWSIEDHFDKSFELEKHLESSGKIEELDLVRSISDLAELHYVRQGEPLGLGHAVSMAKQHISGEPFAVLLADDIMISDHPLLSGMMQLYGEQQCSVLALMEVPSQDISLYGCVSYEPTENAEIVRVTGIVEKPDPDEAPSNFAVIGRYIFTPEIFDCLDKTKPGRNGEIQLTDAISLLLKQQPIFGYVVKDGRFDVGTKIDYLTAIVELALVRDDLGPQFLAILTEIVSRFEDKPSARTPRERMSHAMSEIMRKLEHKPKSK
ncbi:MAG: UTP--glucose-1-phosphate uridylyltransferase GalU [Actinomycetota bacterium]|nr:UTP--glucose-1-phosphate uridylyltransferase GalU [Actinomycetota bacterium]